MEGMTAPAKAKVMGMKTKINLRNAKAAECWEVLDDSTSSI